MTTIPSSLQAGTLNTSATVQQSSAQPSVPAASTASSAGESGTASTLVTLQISSVDTESLTYAKPALPSTTWESSISDDVTSLMAKNFQNGTLFSRFQGLGQALLARFSTDGSNFSQSAMRPLLGQTPDASLTKVAQQVLHAAANNQIALNITTRSGAKVAITLGSSNDGLAAQINVTGGTLTDSERKALASLADGFQKAINELSGDTPTLDLGGLTQFDTSILTSVDLHATLKTANGKTQTVDFHADARQRTLSAQMLTGAVNVSVDTSKLSQLGSASQQAQAINAYLKQFDDAQARGHGDKTLMSLFKDAFSQMVATSGDSSASGKANNSIALNDTARSILTGLADFNASIKQVAKSVNPMRPGEVDKFSYQVSQQTEITGRDQDNYTVTQQQQSRLVASYHTTLSGTDGPLMLSGEKKSQNYLYFRIEDSASSQSQLSYSKGELVMAMLSQSASQSMHMVKYILGKLIEDVMTPQHGASSLDLLGMLKSLDSKSLQDDERQRMLDQLSSRVLLQPSPSQIKS